MESADTYVLNLMQSTERKYGSLPMNQITAAGNRIVVRMREVFLQLLRWSYKIIDLILSH